MNTSSSTKHKRTATIHQKNNSTHFRKRLEEFKIFDAINITIKDGREEYDPKRYRLLDAVINDSRDGGKLVNYVCFLYDYFQAVSSDAWPRKEEILVLYLSDDYVLIIAFKLTT